MLTKIVAGVALTESDPERIPASFTNKPLWKRPFLLAVHLKNCWAQLGMAMTGKSTLRCREVCF